MFLLIAGILFAVYVTNVFLGATSGSAFMGDVAEMITLFCAAIFFTVAILKREAQEKAKQNNEP